jgi:transposase
MKTNPQSTEMLAKPESAHMSSHNSARMPPIELITRGERRRRWTVEQKQTIAAQSLAPGASATEVARQHGIGTGQLYNWRKALLAAQPAAPVPGRFACVELAAARTRRAGESNLIPAPPPLTSAQPAGLIEITLTTGTTLRVDAQVDPRALRRVLGALRG